MSLTDKVTNISEEILEGDIYATRSVSERLMQKIAGNSNGAKESLTLKHQTFNSNGTWVAPTKVYFAVVVVGGDPTGFNLQQFGGDAVALGNGRGFKFYDNIVPGQSYGIQVNAGGFISVMYVGYE